MDAPTVKHYTNCAPERCAAYEGVNVSEMHQLMLRHFGKGTRLLEIGCGSGRDAAFLALNGRDVTAIDASQGMIDAARQAHPEIAGSFSCNPFPFPPDSQLPSQTFDGVYAIAVVMHVPEEELFEFAFQIKSALQAGGTLILSFSTDRTGLCEGRDQAGRLFLERQPGRIQLLFERLGFRLLEQREGNDGMGRDIAWHTLVLRLATGTGSGPVDQIETVINRDRKDATYKLALLRALCDIAQTEYHQAIWGADDTVSVPLGLVAEKWLLYYWPIVEADLAYDGPGVAIPQKRGLEINKPIAFRRELLALVEHCCDGRGGLDAFHFGFRNGALPSEAAAITDAALNKIAQTIVAGPVTYAGGAIDDQRRFFWRDGAISRKGQCGSSQGVVSSLGRVHMRGEIWRELALVGHWISEAIILRWAELTHEISRKQVTIAAVVGRLLVTPTTTRDQQRVRDLYGSLPDLRCVWTESVIGSRRGFEIDHIIPFSLWRNNDLWNLVPATREANNAKRDRLVSRERLRSSRDLILDYWQATRKTSPDRFDYEIRRSLLGTTSPASNWEAPAFSALSEAIESVACQRGIPRWPECSGNTVSLAAPAVASESVSGDLWTLVPACEQEAVTVPGPGLERCAVLSLAEVSGREFVTALPLVAELAAGSRYDGFLSRFLDIEAEDWLDVPGSMAGKNHFVVRVNGDSMEPGLSDGDYIVCEWHRTPRRSGQVVIMGGFDDGTFAIKRFGESKTDWLFHSDNPAYDPIRIAKIDVPSHPILGIAIHNLSQDCPVR
jgi:SOS-response transcriptional repressor LexA/SAM-dependent methyltransferase